MCGAVCKKENCVCVGGVGGIVCFVFTALTAP